MKDTRIRNSQQLGRTARLKRQEKGLSQNALAAQLGVGRKWVIHLESGNPKAELGLVLKALDTLDLDVSLADKRRATQESSSGSSRLEEVFDRLQRPARK